MSNELTMNASIAVSDSELAAFTFAIPANLQKTLTTKKYVYNKMSVTVAEIAIPLGNLTTLGYYLFVNRDTTNFVELRVATGGIKFAKLDATNGFVCGKFGSGITAPFALADTAACQLEYVIFAI